MMPELEAVVCSLCDSIRHEPLLSGPDRLMGHPGQFHFVRCLSCGLIRQSPRPVAVLETYYPEHYPPFVKSDVSRGGFLRQAVRDWGQKKRVKIVRQFCEGGQLLDVGCATGDFLLKMQKQPGWRVMGIEPVEHACRQAQAIGLDVICSTMAEAGLAESTFDVITLWCVLEHATDPVAELTQAWRILRQGGLLIFSVPVWESRLRKWFGPYWVEWDLPRHMHIFSDQAIERLLEITGFQRLQRFTPFSEHRIFHMSVMNWAKEHIRSVLMLQNLDAFLDSLLVRAALFLPFKVVTWPHSGSVAVFVARKGLAP